MTATTRTHAAIGRVPDIHVLRAIEQRVMWLAVRMVDSANHDRDLDEVKVGGHQASSTSMVGIMTALWFAHLDAGDKVAVKPHASPVYHAIKYLTGDLERSYLTRLREFGGLQAYPSRTKDPDVYDFSTGSVGLGVVAPLFAAAVRRYIDAHFGARVGRVPRFVALAGDAELDEGNVWEAIADPALRGLGNVMWVIDTNRQSLDRVIPDQKVKKLIAYFQGAGWHVVEAKYGALLTEAFSRPRGHLLRNRIDEMSNEEYQALFGLVGADLRERLLSGEPPALREFLAAWTDAQIAPLIQNLAGHDLSVLVDSYRACDAASDRPSVVFAYTVKGWGLPIAGDPLNHSTLLSTQQIDILRDRHGLTLATEWDGFDPSSPEGELCADVGSRLSRCASSRTPLIVPHSVGRLVGEKPVSTQETFGKLLTRLDDEPEVGRRIVTTSPDVSVSTNLGGWINKVGVFAPDDHPNHLGDGRLLRWTETPAGRHVELGISEMNLFLMLQALGLGPELHDEQLLPIGTVYDPFVCRGLDALIYGLYSGARFVVVGTPAGITLAAEGGAHQSSITPSIGLELPGLSYAEPAYARALDWLLCDGLARLTHADGDSLYLRLSTRPIDQGPFEARVAAVGEVALRADVLSGGYRLREPEGSAGAVLATCGAVTPEALRAAELLESEGVPVVVLDVTSSDRLYREWRGALRSAASSARSVAPTFHLARLLAPHERHLPIVTIQDAASHHLAWIGSVFGARVVPVGVDSFGQSGRIADLYQSFDLTPDQIVNATLVATA